MDFAALHRPGHPLLLLNVWEFGLAAHLVAQGLPAVGTTSLGVSAAAGQPDGAPQTRHHTVALAASLCTLNAFVSVDLADGFSEDPAEVAALAQELAALGVAGINLEDGRPDGSLVDLDHQRAKIRAVTTQAPTLFVNARTDTHWLTDNPPSVDEALARAHAYVEAGASGIFIPGLKAPSDIEAASAALDVPLNVLFQPGKTLSDLASLGVARVSLGSLSYRVALAAAADSVLAVAEGRDQSVAPPSYPEVVALLPS
ncbi:2-Methylisocitrate lyase, PEP mutase family [Amycolatopsis xylanica]|uniref:2-Methylisocitrate lyase, PEP mutase family n=1 Tax=Amycolatopsis xylanica TaxID=589385 RepID=A0A1H3GKA1_9PSEU|nr:isocitrate lyase/phosphoenolpyruvate mutase family protein [Amycolatopsis xylanica]SDY03772.1 2-Methylisocitrate lyase, PEP mutase family [Amycolatopsis xylanica]